MLGLPSGVRVGSCPCASRVGGLVPGPASAAPRDSRPLSVCKPQSGRRRVRGRPLSVSAPHPRGRRPSVVLAWRWLASCVCGDLCCLPVPAPAGPALGRPSRLSRLLCLSRLWSPTCSRPPSCLHPRGGSPWPRAAVTAGLPAAQVQACGPGPQMGLEPSRRPLCPGGGPPLTLRKHPALQQPALHPQETVLMLGGRIRGAWGEVGQP